MMLGQQFQIGDAERSAPRKPASQHSSVLGPLGTQGDLLESALATQVRRLLEQGAIAEARTYLREVWDAGFRGADLAFLNDLLGPSRSVRESSTKLGSESRAAGARYQSGPLQLAAFAGRWVALDGNRVVESAPSLDALERSLSNVPRKNELVIHWVGLSAARP